MIVMKPRWVLYGVVLVIILVLFVSAERPTNESGSLSLLTTNETEGNDISETTQLTNPLICDNCLASKQDEYSDMIVTTEEKKSIKEENKKNEPKSQASGNDTVLNETETLITDPKVEPKKQDEYYSDMIVSKEEKKWITEENKKHERESWESGIDDVQDLQAVFNIRHLVPYIASERDQNACGNCWVWPGTTALELDRYMEEYVSQRLSIQFLDSNYGFNPKSYGSQFACCGGNIYDFEDFYNDADFRKVIPWSNTNAAFADGIKSCPPDTTPAISYASISTSESNAIETPLSVSYLNTYSGETTAINTIKSQIYYGKPVYYAVYYSGTYRTAFNNFWSTQPETAIWDPDPYNGVATSYGHALTIIGYNDTDANPANHYWEVLNSWGTTAGRPNGVFRLKMHMNYDGADNSGYRNHMFYTLEASWPTTSRKDRIGIFRPSTTKWYQDYDSNGLSDYQVTWAASTDKVVVGDWDGDDRDEHGIFRPSTGRWYLDYDCNGVSDYQVVWGDSTDIPVAGDWDADNKDEIGLWRPSTHRWYLDYDNNGQSDFQVTWGANGDIPVVGDWDADWREEIGLYRPSTHTWYLDYDNNGQSNKQVSWGQSTDKPIAGNWDTDLPDEIGLFRPSTHRWYLDYDNNGQSDYQVVWGTSEDIPLAGDWT